VLGVCVTFLGNAVYNYIYQQFRPFRWLLYGYRWVNAEYQYCIEDDTKLQHTQLIAITIKAIRRGVSIFENKYLWSGHGKQESLEILSTGHELLFSTTRQEHYFPYNRWKYYYVYVGHELPMKRDVIVNIKQVLYDDEGRFEPYVSKTITEPLESLKLRVLLPENLSFTNAFNNEFDHIGPNNKKIKNEPNPSRIIREKGNLYKELYYEIQKPHRNHKYEIRWEWVK